MTRTRPSAPVGALAALASVVLACAGCADPGDGWQPPEHAFRDFQLVVPVLLRDCGFHACHGSEDRFYRIYGPGRARLDPATPAYDAMTGDEASASFTFALSMIDTQQLEQSLLLRKPLAVEAGGAHHEGVDRFGRDVYRTQDDQGYRAIEEFVLSVGEDAP